MVIVTALLVAAPVTFALVPTTTLVSVNSAGTGSGNAQAQFANALSANGRFVLFTSDASDLVTNDTNGSFDVFVRDLKRGTTTLVSANSAGTASGNADSFAFALSANGRFVLFQSNASDLVANDTNGSPDVFVRDLKRGTTTLVSVNRTGTASGNATSRLSGLSALSADGRFVLFQSDASDLVANDTNGSPDVFVRDLKRGTTALASVNLDGTASANFSSFAAALSTNGRFALFTSYASDLVATPKGNPTACGGGPCADVFVRDLKLGTTALVSMNSAGTASSNAQSQFANALSTDGRFVLFTSDASDLAANDTNGRFDIFVRDLKLGTTTLVSANSAGTASSNAQSQFADALSANGRFVLFTSDASDLVANDANGTFDIFMRDLKRGTTSLVSVNSAGTASGNADSGGLLVNVLSPNGRFVLFTSHASDLVANDTNGSPDAFVRDLKLGTTTLVSVNSAGTASGNAASGADALSTNGRFVLFDSSASDLVASQTNGSGDVFVRQFR